MPDNQRGFLATGRRGWNGHGLDHWWSDDVERYMGRRRLSLSQRFTCVGAMAMLLGNGFSAFDPIPWWVYRDWGECRVFADCFNTPGVVRLYWKDAKLATHPIAEEALAICRDLLLPAFFPFDDCGANPSDVIRPP